MAKDDVRSDYESERQAEDAMREFAEGMESGSVEECFKDVIVEALRREDRSGADIVIGEVDVGELSFTPPDVDEGEGMADRRLLRSNLGRRRGAVADGVHRLRRAAHRRHDRRSRDL